MPIPGAELKEEELVAPKGMFRVIKSSVYPGPDFFVNDFCDKGEALKLMREENKSPTEQDIEHYVYDDEGSLVFN